MKILSLSPYLPTESSGHAGAQLIFRNLCSLARDHEIQLLTFHNREEAPSIRILEERGVRIQSFPYERKRARYSAFELKRLARGAGSAGLALIKGTPFFVQKYQQQRFARGLAELVGSFQPHLVHFEYNVMAPYLEYIGTTPSVLTVHDVSTKVYQRAARSHQGLQSILFGRNSRRWEAYESLWYPRFTRLITLTREDADFMEGWTGIPPRDVIPPQISVRNHASFTKIPNRVVFLGSYSRMPNVQAVDALLRHIWPVISAGHPDLELILAGGGMPRAMRNRIADTDRVSYTGFVDEVDAFLGAAALMIAPILSGAGLKMKIPHALACGTPVLTTPVGAEGIPMGPEDGLFTIPDLGRLAHQGSRLLESPGELEALGRRGRVRVRAVFNEEEIVKSLKECYSLVLGGTGI